MAHPPRHAVVLAGGAGSRLWPASRAARPKFVLELLPDRPSSLVDTWNRLLPIVGTDHIWVVTGSEAAPAVVEALPDLVPSRLLVEPSPKDSLAALALATAAVGGEAPDAVVAAFPADNHATDRPAFAQAVESAFAAATTGVMCAVGMVPTSASTAFGYIEVDPEVSVTDQPGARRALAFNEKPSLPVATSYVEGRRHLWNGGIYVATVTTLLRELADLQPGVLAAVVAPNGTTRMDTAAWDALDPLSIDHGLSEPLAAAGRLDVVPAEFGWKDTGDFAALFRALAGKNDPAATLLVDASGLIMSMSGRTVSVLGIEDVVVVDTPDALLVTTLDHAQRIREIVGGWRTRGRTELL